METDSPPRDDSGRAPPGPPRRGALEERFEGFGDRTARFVRSLVTLAEFKGDLGSYAAEPNLRIVRTAFGKWVPDLLIVLAPRRRTSFGELRRLLPGISARVLSGKLRRLEASGLINRTVVPSRPPRPEYSLTLRAQALVRVSGQVLAYVQATQTVSGAARAGEKGTAE